MGVHGLSPFLQKKVFREIPNRLRGLRDKTIVIDGTLITQRLHYSPMPHEYRHVLGWYRIVRQLQRNGVGVICVFDGPERTLAKMRERERRQAVRNLTLVRGTIEGERVNRLDQLSKLIQTFHALPTDKRAAALQQLQMPSLGTADSESSPSAAVEEQLHPHSRPDVAPQWSYRQPRVVDRWVSPYTALAPAPTAPDPATSPAMEDTAPRISYYRPAIVHRWLPPHLDYVVPTVSPRLPVQHEHEPVEAFDAEIPGDDFIGADFATVEQGAILYDGYVDELRDTKAFAWDLEELGLPKHELEALISDIDSERMRWLSTDEPSITQSLAELYNDYRQSIPKFRVPARFEQDLAVPAESEYAMSQYQYELMLQEGALWDALMAPDAPDTAHALHVRSAAIAASYAKRNAAPSKATYDESQQMLLALGVPCLSSDGPHEGEAFASALVHAGVADYVASEDTDVLVYEAPLLRGLTNLRSPLVAISGAEVREALELSRAAYVDFALLLGTDFSRRLRGLGPMRSIALIRQHGTIEGVLAARGDAMDDAEREEYLHEIELARAVFNSLPDVSRATVEVGAPPAPDDGLVRDLLHAYGLTHAAVDVDEDNGSADAHAGGFGAEFWLESGHGEAAPSIGVDMFRDGPDAAALARA